MSKICCKYLLFFTLLGSMKMLYSNSAVNDSISTITSLQASNTSKVYRLNSLALSLYTSDPRSSYMVAQRSFEISNDFAFKRGAFEALHIQVEALLKLSITDSAFLCSRTLIEVAESISDKKLIAKANDLMATAGRARGYKTIIVNFHKQSIDMYTQLGDSASLAMSLSNYAATCDAIGDQKQAIALCLRSIKLLEMFGAKTDLAQVRYKLAGIYKKVKNYPLATSYYLQTISISEMLGMKELSALAYKENAWVYALRGEKEQALATLQKAIKIYEEFKNDRGVAKCYEVLSEISILNAQYGDAINACNKALGIVARNDEWEEIAKLNNLLAKANFRLRKYSYAIQYYNTAIEIARLNKCNDEHMEALKGLSESYFELKNYQQAYFAQDQYLQIRNRLNDEFARINTEELQYKFDSDKKEKEVELLNKNKELIKVEMAEKEAEVNRRKTLNNAVFAGLALLLVLVFFIYRSYIQKKKANRLLESAYALIENKNILITDSIDSAKTIQDALLKSEDDIRKMHTGVFLFYSPKDIVSGDFYWFESDSNKLFIAAADCTGHGVPGAFMTFVGYNMLDRIFKNNAKQASPAEMLQKLHGEVQNMFSSTSYESIKSSMDIALVRFDKDTYELEYAGARNPLYVVSDGVLKEYKANKIQIGSVHAEGKEFTNNRIQLKKGDSFYIFTDGYADQIGGPSREKFFYQPFRELIQSVSMLSPQGQKDKIERTFVEWKGLAEQTDDVMVIGVVV